jgi:HK97 family phage portal protein
VTTRGGVLRLGSAELEVMHFRGIPPYDEYGRGFGVLDRHARALGFARGVREFAASSLTNGVPPGFLKVSNPNLSQVQADDLKRKWMETYGTSTRSIAVLNAQAIDMMKMSLLDVALACGVEPSMLGVSADSNTYANVESRQIQFQTFSLLPYVSRMEDTLSTYLPQGRRVDIIMRALLRTDSQTRIDGYAQALRDGWMNVNEVRILEGLEPVPGGDEFAFQRKEREARIAAKNTDPASSVAGKSGMTDDKGGVAVLNSPRNTNPEKVA